MYRHLGSGKSLRMEADYVQFDGENRGENRGSKMCLNGPQRRFDPILNIWSWIQILFGIFQILWSNDFSLRKARLQGYKRADLSSAPKEWMCSEDVACCFSDPESRYRKSFGDGFHSSNEKDNVRSCNAVFHRQPLNTTSILNLECLQYKVCVFWQLQQRALFRSWSLDDRFSIQLDNDHPTVETSSKQGKVHTSSRRSEHPFGYFTNRHANTRNAINSNLGKF